jgi:RNA polymerase sigma-70 factor (ECF subfamily)
LKEVADPTDWGDLLERFRQGEMAATERLAGLILTFLARFGAFKYRDSWDDIVQEVLIRLWNNLDEIEHVERLVGWIRTTTHNVFVSWCRKHRFAIPTDDLPEQEGDEKRPLPELVELQRALGRLTPAQRRVIETIYFDGRTFVEASRELEMPEGTLRTIRTQAMKALRRSFLDPE